MKYIFSIVALLSVQSIFAQPKLPVIKATSKNVAINDGGILDKNAWSLSPEIKPDIYTADRTRETKWVTFYTDIDSIRIKVKPGTKYDFIVLLNGKDSCYTQIASAIPPVSKFKNAAVSNDTIPFILTAYNAIHVKSVINNTDTLNLHFDLSSFDFHLTKDAILKRTKLLANQPDALAGKTSPNYNKLSKVFRLQMGNTVWNDPQVLPTLISANDMDGRFGWNLFEGKQIEIDYDRSILIIHTTRAKALKGYTKAKLNFVRSFVSIKGSFAIANQKYTGDFIMDTGSEQAIILDSTWAARQSFINNLKLIRLSELSDPRGVKYKIKLVQAPSFVISTFGLTDIPTLVLGSKNPMGVPINYLGNDVLKRFNMILDFSKDEIYLKPNHLISAKYHQNS
jgi:hypothetical protein